MSVLKLAKNAFDRYRADVDMKLKTVQAFFQSELYPEYQEAMKTKFETEGKSEGTTFPASSPRWVQRKVRDKERAPSLFPGGPKRLVHSGRLVSNLVGVQKNWHVKLITPRKMTVGIKAQPYAKFVNLWSIQNGGRSLTYFSPRTVYQWKSRTARFLNRTLKR